ncbi:uroporphyrinogen-III synthase [Sulfurimonas sp. SAG-AH-194-C21]|nr:uroporphyrinogen-III synthase [Sulfurimonas sp. SAG-AH-194-C21]MDF1883200.1 uroporphyrinogen-III synthase [Sulfurimonas sp. SAG-AH-194-C21]
MKSKPYLFSTSSHRDTIHVNPLEISFLQPLITFSQYDYIILTSKQAVIALNQYDYDDFKDKKALCISKATAQSFRDIKGKVLAVGAGYGDDLSEIINLYPKDTKWLYLRAKKVASDFAKVVINNGYSVDEVIAYESNCSPNIQTVKLIEEATLIFTSPSSIKCFLKYHKLKEEYRVIVIGQTTAKALPSHINPIIANEPSIESCLKIINSL